MFFLHFLFHSMTRSYIWKDLCRFRCSWYDGICLLIIIKHKYLEFYLSWASYPAATCKLQLKGEYPAVSQTCFMASNSSPLNFPEFPLDCDFLCDSACCNDSSPSGSACVRVRPLKLIAGKLQMLAFPTAVSKYHFMSPISVFIAQIMSNLGAFWRNNVTDGDISVLQAVAGWQGGRGRCRHCDGNERAPISTLIYSGNGSRDEGPGTPRAC